MIYTTLCLLVGLQLVSQEGSSHYECVNTRRVKNYKEKKNSVSKDKDISMVNCHAYGEVGAKTTVGEIEDGDTAGGVYEHI